MAINTTPTEMTTGDGDYPESNATNDLDFSTLERHNKAFSTLRAAYALKGHALHRTDPADGSTTYLVERNGQVRHLSSLETARQFLEHIGGQL